MIEPGNSIKCRIAVDAMGGDYAPKHEILGAIAAMKEDKNFDLTLRPKHLKDYVGQVTGIEAVTIEFFPRWLNHAPNNPEKITVNIVDQITTN